MNPDLLATIYSFLYILLVIGIAFILYRYAHLKSEWVRKFMHILISFWAFILVYAYDSFYWSIVGPCAFIVINTVFVYSGFAKYLGMGDRKRDNGLIYYPLSILALIVMEHFGLLNGDIVIASILAMGLGDGIAALAGSAFGRHSYVSIGGKKSLEGTLAMFIVSASVFFIIFPSPWYVPLVTALIATAFENLTPLGFDNITVPMSTAVTLGVFYGLF